MQESLEKSMKEVPNESQEISSRRTPPRMFCGPLKTKFSLRVEIFHVPMITVELKIIELFCYVTTITYISMATIPRIVIVWFFFVMYKR